MNEYSKIPEITNYFLFILNDTKIEEGIRQISGLTLKGNIERSFINIGPNEIEYFKKNIFMCYLDKRANIRKTISNLVNTFIRIGGLDMWPKVLEILYANLDNDISVTMCLDTLNVIIEDSGTIIEDKYKNVIYLFTYIVCA